MRIVSLAAGIGGLDEAFEGTTVAYSEIERHALSILGVHYPDAEPLGDITTIGSLNPWAPQMVTAGLPCQPVSHINIKRGADTDSRWLFDHFADLIAATSPKPSLVLENVEGILWHGAKPLARFISRIEADGYEFRTMLFDASKVGAPHRRRRWWGLGLHPDSPPPIPKFRPGSASESPELLPSPLSRSGRAATADKTDGGNRLQRTVLADSPRLPTPLTAHRDRAGSPGSNASTDLQRSLLPTPQSGHAKAPRGNAAMWQQLPNALLPTPIEKTRESVGGALTGRSYAYKDLILALLPTPTSNSARLQRGDLGRPFLSADGVLVNSGLADETGRIDPETGWDRFQPVVTRWSQTIGRYPPTRVTRRSRTDMLAAELIEWMMGYPEGWAVGRVTRNQAFGLYANAVVSRQAAAAVTELLAAPSLFANL